MTGLWRRIAGIVDRALDGSAHRALPELRSVAWTCLDNLGTEERLRRIRGRMSPPPCRQGLEQDNIRRSREGELEIGAVLLFLEL